MATSYRPLTSKEKKELQGYVALSTTIGRALLFFAAVAAVAFVIRKFAHPAGLVSPLFWLVPATAFGIWLYLRSKRWTGGPEARKQIAADIADGRMELIRFEVVEAIQVIEGEDEGPSFFLRTKGGEVWLFWGQYLDRLDRKKFPWTSFDVAVAPHSRRFFGLKRLGEPLEPSFVREPFTWDEFKRFRSVKEFGRIDVPFDSLKTKAERKTG